VSNWILILVTHAFSLVFFFGLSMIAELPLLPLTVMGQVMALTSGIYVFPDFTKLFGSGSDSSKPSKVAKIFDDTGKKRKVIKDRYTKRFTNWKEVSGKRGTKSIEDHAGLDHTRDTLGYPEELLENVPATDGCGAACPFLAALTFSPSGSLKAVFKGKRVVDFGCGTGMDSFISNKLGASHVLGMDITPAGIEVAKMHAKTLGVADKMDFILQAIDEPMPKNVLGSADIVTTNGVVNLCERKDKVFMNAYAVLKPGGIFLFSDMIALRELEIPK